MRIIEHRGAARIISIYKIGGTITHSIIQVRAKLKFCVPVNDIFKISLLA